MSENSLSGMCSALYMMQSKKCVAALGYSLSSDALSLTSEGLLVAHLLKVKLSELGGIFKQLHWMNYFQAISFFYQEIQ